MKVICLNCSGTGIGSGTRTNFGELMNLCERCDGHGSPATQPGERPFVAIFAVSARYVVQMRVPRRKGGIVELDVVWSPDVPTERGRRRLRPTERRAYERGRNAALAAVQHQLGGGDWSVLSPQDMH